MKVYVDADACPVKDIIISESSKRSIDVIMICDTSHIINDEYSTVITVDKSSNSADMVIINKIEKEDIVVTQDFGLAAVVISKGAFAINQNGMIYTDENIDGLLFERFLAKKSRNAGKKTKNMSKRTSANDEDFKINYIKLLER